MYCVFSAVPQYHAPKLAQQLTSETVERLGDQSLDLAEGNVLTMLWYQLVN